MLSTTDTQLTDDPPSSPSSSSFEEKPKREEVTACQDLVAGGVAGSASVIIGHPFDTLKVRMQTSSSPVSIVSMRSLFSGILPPLSTATIINALIFSSYGISSRFYDYLSTDSQGTFDETSKNSTSNTNWKKSMVCGSFAGAVQCVVICPMDHIKCRLQISQTAYTTSLDAVNHIYATHGIPGLYRGLAVTAWREIPAFGIYFATYDYVKDYIQSTLATNNQNQLNQQNQLNDMHFWGASALAGGCSGCLSWSVIYPLDVIKTQIQTSNLDKKMPMIQTGFNILKQNNWRFFFRGMGVTLIRAFPVNGIIFPVYEFTLSYLNRFNICA